MGLRAVATDVNNDAETDWDEMQRIKEQAIAEKRRVEMPMSQLKSVIAVETYFGRP